VRAGIKFPDDVILSESVKELVRLLTDPEPSQVRGRVARVAAVRDCARAQRATLAVVMEHTWIASAKPKFASGTSLRKSPAKLLTSSTSTSESTSTHSAAKDRTQ
jgi:hypothetical protein